MIKINIKNILIWGAGDGGLRTYNSLHLNTNVLAFIDSDNQKQNKYFCHKLVISPNKINKYDFDYIFISNIHNKDIKKDLIYNYNIDPSKIIEVYQNDLYDVRLGYLRYISQEINDLNLNGSVAELGVYKGSFAKYINILFKDKDFYLFDTFDGFNLKDIYKETPDISSHKNMNLFKDTSVDKVIREMEYPNNCKVIKGYFPKSLENHNINTTFCFVSLDADLYQPIYDGLNYFYDRLVKNGYIMIHDYNSSFYSGTKKAVNQFCKERNITCVPLMDLCGSAIIIK